MTENMKNFLAKVSEDKALAEKISQLDMAALIAAAKELGFELTEADFAQPEGEISEGELSGVTGGGSCYCMAGGGGTKGKLDNTCACVIAGYGDGKSPESDKDEFRCYCSLYGQGVDLQEHYDY